MALDLPCFALLAITPKSSRAVRVFGMSSRLKHMSTRFETISAIIAASLLALIACALWSCSTANCGITVTVNNESGDDVTDLRLKFTGGSKTAAKLTSADSFATRVNPGGSSHLAIEFADSSGNQHSANLDVYFERRYRGTIRVTIWPDGRVSWNGETQVQRRLLTKS